MTAQNGGAALVRSAPQESARSTALCGRTAVLKEVWTPSLPAAFSMPADGGAYEIDCRGTRWRF